ncbi:MAG: hypothetical protein M3358_11660, partial [Actinomycetota bacterium]|nr:hypothetical protein [Actinomycetota bacterium]
IALGGIALGGIALGGIALGGIALGYQPSRFNISFCSSAPGIHDPEPLCTATWFRVWYSDGVIC